MLVNDRVYVRYTAIAHFYVVSKKACIAYDMVGNVCQLVLEMLYVFLSRQIY